MQEPTSHTRPLAEFRLTYLEDARQHQHGRALTRKHDIRGVVAFEKLHDTRTLDHMQFLNIQLARGVQQAVAAVVSPRVHVSFPINQCGAVTVREDLLYRRQCGLAVVQGQLRDLVASSCVAETQLAVLVQATVSKYQSQTDFGRWKMTYQAYTEPSAAKKSP